MRQSRFANILLLLLSLTAPLRVRAQNSPSSSSLTIAGYATPAPVIQVNGKSYVEVEALARTTHGSLTFQGNRIVLTLAAQSAGTPQQPKPGFSKDFLRAEIEALSVIREWRSAIVNAVQNNYPVADDWVSGYRRTADSKMQLTSASTATESDRSGLALLTTEFNNMQKLSDKYLALHKNLTYISPDSFDNDPLDRQVMECSRGLVSLAASSQFEDVPTCH